MCITVLDSILNECLFDFFVVYVALSLFSLHSYVVMCNVYNVDSCLCFMCVYMSNKYYVLVFAWCMCKHLHYFHYQICEQFHFIQLGMTTLKVCRGYTLSFICSI